MRHASFLGDEPVAHARFGLQVLGTGGVTFQFAAQLGDVDPEILSLFGVLGAPHLVQQLPLGENLAGVLDQYLKQLVRLMDRRRAARIRASSSPTAKGLAT